MLVDLCTYFYSFWSQYFSSVHVGADGTPVQLLITNLLSIILLPEKLGEKKSFELSPYVCTFNKFSFSMISY